MSTIIINDANNEQVNVLSKLAKLLKLTVTVEKHYSESSKMAIDQAIDAYENGQSEGLKLSINEFKKMINGLKQDN
jgi:hypothetical protein